MAVRSAQEINTRLRDIFGEQTPDGYLELLEDITDSVGQIPADMVSRADYDTAISERDSAVAAERSMRDRYINRFYNNYNEPNNKGIIEGEAPQEEIEQKEKSISYDDLFE